ncbi:MAG: hypothetical protein NC388_09830 [Clostridium sp.]|nr:hypothetical protein [Clostridium sp.]
MAHTAACLWLLQPLTHGSPSRLPVACKAVRQAAFPCSARGGGKAPAACRTPSSAIVSHRIRRGRGALSLAQ